MRGYGAVSEARISIGRYLAFYNSRRPHSSLAARTPDQKYFYNLPVMMAARVLPPIWGVTPVGLRPPCMTIHIGKSKKATGRRPTYPLPILVQTNRAIS